MMEKEFICESELGTKEYWDRFYSDELENYQDHGDPGETWFGTRNLQKIIQWIEKKNLPKDVFICDIGCGNGLVLAKLAERGFRSLFGVDYSSKAIEFCRMQFSRVGDVEIRFEVVDILSENIPLSLTNEKFDVMIDKGTYDAICLMPNGDLAGNRKKYLRYLDNHLKMDGYFIIISCNFTKNELIDVFCENFLNCIDEFDSPVISFGGSTGKQVTGLVFQRK